MQVGVGDLVRPRHRVSFGVQLSVDPSDVGLVLQVWEPTIRNPYGAAEVRFSGNREASLMWKELEVISKGRGND